MSKKAVSRYDLWQKPRRKQGLYNFQESALVFVLGHHEILEIEYSDFDGNGIPASGTLTTTKKKQLQQFTNTSGYHVRTIPGERWANPVSVAAGAGRVAVLDRGASADTIRVTNKYGGADAVYSDDHLSYPEFDWSAVSDEFSVDVPTGYRVTGMQILERDVLVACLAREADWQTQTETLFLSYDFQGYATLTHATSEDLVEITDVPNGVAWGRPSMVHHAQPHDPISFVAASRPVGTGISGMTQRYNLHRNRLLGERSLPSGWHPLGVTSSHGVMNVLATTTEPTDVAADPHEAASDTGLRRVFRLMADPRQGLLEPPSPQEREVSTSFDQKDSIAIKDIRYDPQVQIVAEDADQADSYGAYLDFVSKNQRQFETSRSPFESREQTAEYLAIKELAYDTERDSEVYAHYIDVGEEVIDVDCCGNHSVEICRHDDDTLPLFNSLHVSHYDWLSEGGYRYYSPS